MNGLINVMMHIDKNVLMVLIKPLPPVDVLCLSFLLVSLVTCLFLCSSFAVH